MAEHDGTLKIKVDLDTKEFQAGSKDLEAAARRTAGKISGTGEKAKIALEKQLNAFSALNQQYERQEQKVEQLKQKLKELSGQKIKTDEFSGLEKQTNSDIKKLETLKTKMEELKSSGKATVQSQDYKDVSKQIESTTSKLSRLEETQKLFMESGGKRTSSAYKKREIQIEDLRNTLRYAEAEQRDLLKSGDAYVTSPVFEKLSAQAKELEESIKRTRSEMDRLTKSGGAYKAADTSELQTKLGAEQEKLTQMGNRLATSSAALNAKIQEFKDKEEAAAKSTGNLAKKEKNLTDITDKLKRAAGRAGQKIKGMVEFVKKPISAVKNLGRESNRTRMSLGKMLATSVLFSTVFRMISAVTNGVKTGFENLAQYSDQTNTSISSLMTSLTYLKNTFATTFAPILNVAAPILTTFINLIARAVTYVGMFFAALTGQKSFIKAVPVQENFAAGLSDTASNAKDAADGIKDAAKAADDYLSPLDEISRYETDKDAGSSGGGGGTGGVPGYTPPSASEMFETVPIDSAIQNFVDKIKSLIAAQDWDGLGELLAGKINSVMERVKDAVSWDKVGPQITYFVNAFTFTFNSLVRNIDWDLMGRTVGTGINTIVNTLSLLITGIDWKLIGSSFATGVNGIVDEVDWWNLGALIGQKFMIARDVFYGFVTTLDWSKAGLAVANGINGAIANIDGETIAEGISAFAIGVLTAITSALQNTDWEKVGQTIADMLKTVDWVGIGSQLYEAGKSLITGLLEAFNELPLPVMIAAGTILTFWGIVSALKTVNSITTAVKGLGTAIGGISATASISTLSLIGLAVALVPVKNAFSELSDVVKEKMDIIAEELWGSKKRVEETANEIEGQTEKTSRKVTSMAEKAASDTGSSAEAGMAAVWTAVHEKESDMESAAQSTIRDPLTSAAEEAKDETEKTIDDTIHVVNAKIVGSTPDVEKSSKSVGNAAIGAVGNGAKAGTAGVLRKMRDISDSMYTTLKEKDYSPVGTGITSGISAGIDTGWGWLASKVQGLASSMLNTAKSALGIHSPSKLFRKEVGENISLGIAEGVEEKGKEARDAVEDISETMADNFDLSPMENALSDFVETIGKALSDLPGKAAVKVKLPSIAESKLPQISTGTVMPRIARGTVIPAMVAGGGAQKSKSDEADLIESLKALLEEKTSGGNTEKGSASYRFTAQINRRVLFDEMMEEARIRQSQSGENPFEIA